MHKQFEVSVIIPVYNAEKYVVRAINSALEQPEVKEVIVVDDGHADNAYELCQQIAERESRVKLFTHPNRENLGAAVSRNLGMLNSSCDYISFLDADDYFLTNRFKFTKETFDSDPKIEGVYEPVGFEFFNQKAFDRSKVVSKALQNKTSMDGQHISYVINPYSGEALFKSFILGGNGWPHTIGITIRKNLIAKVGLFNPALRLHQDTDYWIRLSYHGFLSHTSNHIHPVSVRNMHDENRTYHQSPKSQLYLWQVVVGWASTVQMDKNHFARIFKRYQDLLSLNGTN